MAEISEKFFPFDAEEVSGEPDRVYYSEDWTRYFAAFISSGTFMKESSNLQVISNGDMTVTLKPGSMIIEGARYDNTEDIIINLDPADGVQNRIDRIAITWSKSDRDIHYTLRSGELSYEPIAPECRRNEEYKDYVVADILVEAGVIIIEQTAITDQRLNSEVCGLAIPFAEVNTEEIFIQLQAFYDKTVSESQTWQQEQKESFETWYESVKDILNEDTALNLQNQIGNLEELTTDEKESLVKAINEVNSMDVLDSAEEIEANTQPGKVAGALGAKELFEQVIDSAAEPVLITSLSVSTSDTSGKTTISKSVDSSQFSNYRFLLLELQGNFSSYKLATQIGRSGEGINLQYFQLASGNSTANSLSSVLSATLTKTSSTSYYLGMTRYSLTSSTVTLNGYTVNLYGIK